MGLEKINTSIGRDIIAWTRTSGKSLLVSKPVKINTEGLKLSKPQHIGDTLNLVTKPKTLRNLTKTEFEPAEFVKLGIKYPNGTTKIIKILEKKPDNSLTEIFIFKGKNGKSLGSLSSLPDNRKLAIRIDNTNISDTIYDSCTSKAIDIEDAFSNSRTLITKGEFSGKNLLEKQTIFTEIFKPQKPKNDNNMYMSVIKTGKKTLNDGQTRFSQNVMQIETGTNPSKIGITSQSKMGADGEMVLESITQNGVNMDTSNPYFQTLLMEPQDMLKASYANIIKKRNLKGIEPPLCCDKKVFNGKYEKVAGNAPEDSSYIGVNLILPNRNKIELANTLAHECEHAFTQNGNIHLSGLKDMRSNNEYSRSFFDGLAERFKPIKKGTKEYQDAKQYLHELETYDNTVFTKDLKVNHDAWEALKIEQAAVSAGNKEEKNIKDCIDNFIENFNLFNVPYVTTWLK